MFYRERENSWVQLQSKLSGCNKFKKDKITFLLIN